MILAYFLSLNVTLTLMTAFIDNNGKTIRTKNKYEMTMKDALEEMREMVDWHNMMKYNVRALQQPHPSMIMSFTASSRRLKEFHYYKISYGSVKK